jgi:hypothetical protein
MSPAWYEKKLGCFLKIEKALVTFALVFNKPVKQVFKKILLVLPVRNEFGAFQVCTLLCMRKKARVFL